MNEPVPDETPEDDVLTDWIFLPCCPNEKRNMNGGCDSCGDPCL